MNKKQAQEYYEQLKGTEKAKEIQLDEVIHILTSGGISTVKAREFMNHVEQNQFGEYGHISEYIEAKDWQLLAFSQVYQVLKYLKLYLKRQKAQNPQRGQKSESETGTKDLMSSFDSKHPNHTVEEMLIGLKDKSQKIDSRVLVLERDDEVEDQQRWKVMKFRLVKKLLVIFDYMRKSMHVEGESFERNKNMAENMNLVMFMRYIKHFELGNTFKNNRIIKSFKDNAVNTLWVDFDRFVNANFTMIGVSEQTPSEEKYLRLKGLFDLIRSEDMKKMLNVRAKTVLTTIVEGHTGTYKQDILNFLHQKYQQRVKREKKKWSGKRLKTDDRKNVVTGKGDYNFKQKILKSSSVNKLNSRIKSQHSPSIYQQLKLPQLRIKEHKNQSIYESLKTLDVREEKEKLKQIINLTEQEEYLDQYLKEEAKTVEKKKKKSKKLFELPTMRFT